MDAGLRRLAWALALAAVTVCGGVAVTPAAAQETRAAVIAQKQAEKATQLHPHEPNKAERLALRFEEALQKPPRVYVWFGSIYSGGLFAVGPGVRHRFGGSGLFDAHAAWSLRNYKLVDSSLRLPDIAGGRVHVTGQAQWIDAPRVSYYGVGNDSSFDDRVRFEYRSTTVGGSADVTIAGPLSAGGRVDYLRIDSDASSRDPFGSGAAIFDESPSWVRTTAWAQVDWRPAPQYARRGGVYRVQWANYAQEAGFGSAFHRLDADVQQLVPILREQWIIALRARVATTDTEAGNTVPFYLLPALGGGSTLRGYHSFRFRDNHSLLLTAEYRWTPSHFLDMALFVDTGKVASRRSDLDLTDLHTGYGIGARFHTPTATVLRVDLAHSTDGFVLHLDFSRLF